MSSFLARYDFQKIMKTLLGDAYLGRAKDRNNIDICLKLSSIQQMKPQSCIPRGTAEPSFATQSRLYEDPRRECEMMRQLAQIPNTVTLLHEFESLLLKGVEYHAIVTPWFGGGDLFEFIKRTHDQKSEIQMSWIIRWALTLTHTLHLIHSCQLAHLDITPENLFLDDNRDIFVGDFGQMTRTDKGGFIKLNFLPGKQFYAPPEFEAFQINPQQKNVRFDGYKVDVFALGVTLFLVITGFQLFHSFDSINFQKFKACYENPRGVNPLKRLLLMYKFKQCGNFMMQKYVRIDIGLLNILSQMLEIDPHKRISMRQAWKLFNEFSQKI